MGEPIHNIVNKDPGKRVPWLILKLSQSRSGAVLAIGQKPTELAETKTIELELFFGHADQSPRNNGGCVVVAVISLDARERLSAESLSLNLKFLLTAPEGLVITR